MTINLQTQFVLELQVIFINQIGIVIEIFHLTEKNLKLKKKQKMLVQNQFTMLKKKNICLENGRMLNIPLKN